MYVSTPKTAANIATPARAQSGTATINAANPTNANPMVRTVSSFTRLFMASPYASPTLLRTFVLLKVG
jgi:hypothetical protein